MSRPEIISVEMECGTVVKLPTKFEVCGTCEGRGKHSQHLGAITRQERDDDWDQDEWDSYMAGGYDRTCERCDGDRVVAVIDRDLIERGNNAELKCALVEYDAQVEDDREVEAIHRAEIAFGC